jgi:hypothetical protein
MVWRRYGGPAMISKLTGISPQTLVNWRFRGKIPVTRVKEVADALNVPVWGFNYNDLSRIYDKVPDWKTVVNSYNLDPAAVRYILSFSSGGMIYTQQRRK